MRRWALAYSAALAAASGLFLVFPGIDLWASGLFYRAPDGFFLADRLPVRLVFEGVPYIADATLIGLAAATLFGLWRRRPVLGLDRKAILFLLLSLLLGPGLLVNTVLKDHWGRARPSQVMFFGGTEAFTPAPLPADQCARNCSFVAGHPAMGFYLVSFALLLRRRRARGAAIAAAVGLGAAIGGARIAQGGHFLSDVVFAGLLVYGTSRILHHAIVERDLLGRAPWRRLAASAGTAGGRLILLGAATAALATLCWRFVDRPLALYLHGTGADRIGPLQELTRLGIATGYLVAAAALFLLLFLASRWTTRPVLARRLAAYAWLPLFVFLAVALSGLATDLLKTLFGRARPRLLFRSDLFGFDWWATRADFWSFPSGHATTIVALMTALACIWPRPLWVYVLVALAVSLSRVAIGAHYLSDVIVGAYVALVVTLYIRRVFERSGIALADARAGALPPRPLRPWRERLGLSHRATLSDSP